MASWKQQRTRIAISCCKDCVPPKRHPGCHSKCDEYNQEKKTYEKRKLEYKKQTEATTISNAQFNRLQITAAKKRHG